MAKRPIAPLFAPFALVITLLVPRGPLRAAALPDPLSFRDFTLDQKLLLLRVMGGFVDPQPGPGSADDTARARTLERDLILVLADRSENLGARLAAGEILLRKTGLFLTSDAGTSRIVESFVTRLIEGSDPGLGEAMLELGVRLVGSVKLNCETDLERDPALGPASL